MATEEHTEDPENFMYRADFPKSYTANSPDEDHFLFIARSFQKQFTLLYPDRRPLLLFADNECGVEKLVSTTLRPTLPTHPDLYTWEGCARFVSNYFSLQPLDPPTELPRTLRSPQAVLQSQRGSSLEYANLLCSMLLGLNYNAYCVSGYASQHLCELDRSQESCPLQEQAEADMLCDPEDRTHWEPPVCGTTGTTSAEQLLAKVLERVESQDESPLLEPQDKTSKYNMRHERKLHSNFILKQEKLTELQDSQPQSEPDPSPSPDPLWGLRVHFWVLVLAGSGGVEQDFLIDPLTGNRYPPGHPYFLGVESAWNELNVHVNMQECDKGCQDMLWDPEDRTHWEPLVYGTLSRKQLQTEALRRVDNISQDQETGLSYVILMPLSWCSMINITEQDIEMCYPGGFKVTHFKKALLENFTRCFCPEGVVTRVTLYDDLRKTKVKKVKEWFENRVDFLTERESSGGFTTERFKPFRSDQLIFHRFNTSAPEVCPAPLPSQPGVTPEREMCFWRFRVDGLVRRVERGYEMIESFEKRRDFLFRRLTLFAEPPKPDTNAPRKDTGLEFMDIWPERQPILKVVEQFHRDPSKAAGEDVAKRAFLLAERRIEVTYHLEKNHVIAAMRSFKKPTESTSTTAAGDFTADMVSTFQVEPTAKPLGQHLLNQLLLNLMKEEKKSITEIRNSEGSVQFLVQDRAEEQQNLRLSPCPWSTSGLDRAREHRQRVMLLGEELRWLEEQQKDLLAPVLMRLNGTTDLSPDQAQTVYQSCLSDFRSHMIQQARLIQQRIEEDTRELEQRQLDFKKKHRTWRKGRTGREEVDDSDHLEFCDKMSRQIQVSQKRLQMHKECAPQKYKALEQQLRAEPRLGPHLQTA